MSLIKESLFSNNQRLVPESHKVSFSKNVKDYFVKMDVMQMRTVVCMLLMFGFTLSTFAQSAAGDYSAGTTALSTVATEIAKYVPVVTKVIYALAGVVALLGATSIFMKMNNGDQDVKKSIMLTVGGCITLIAGAQALPAFFGISNK